MEIHFVTGKGGVGKSAVAAAMALYCAKAGKRTLLVETGTQSFYKGYLGISGVGHLATLWKPGCDLAFWTGESCLGEYARHLVKVDALARLFLENPIAKTLIGVAPALSELAILGKLTSGPRQVGPQFEYDVVIFDAMSSGHFLAMLRAPLGMSELIQRGPMGEQSLEILKVLKDHKITKYHVVALPERLPVEETLELITEVQHVVGLRPAVYLNKWIEYPKGLDPSSPRSWERDFFQKHENQIEALESLSKSWSQPSSQVQSKFYSEPQPTSQSQSQSQSQSHWEPQSQPQILCMPYVRSDDPSQILSALSDSLAGVR